MVNKVAVATTTIEIVVPTTAIGSENNLKIVKLVIEFKRDRERERQTKMIRVLYEQKRWRKEKHFTAFFTISSLSVSSEFSASLLASCPKRKM